MSEQIQALMTQGDQYIQGNKLQEAQNCFLNLLAQQPNVSEAYFRLAWIANKQGQVLSARKNLKKAYDLDPHNKNYVLGLVQLYAQTSKLDDALKCLKNYLQSDPEQDDVWFNYACLLAQSNQFNPALDAFRQCIDLKPEQLSYYMKLGELLYNLLKYREALNVYYQALNKGLHSEGLFLNIAKMHVDSGELEEAKAILKKAIDVYPDNLAFAYRLSSMDKQSLNQDLLAYLKSKDKHSLSAENQFYYAWLRALFAFQDKDLQAELAFLLEAHKTYQALGNFSESAYAYISRLSQLSGSCANLDRVAVEPESDSSEPIFIVGIPRCGSTLIESIIGAGPQEIIKGEETGVVFHALNKTTQGGTINWDHFKQASRMLYQKYKIPHENLTFTDKSLENIFFIDALLALYPKAKIIYCDRAPLASIVSILKNNMAVLPWAHDLDSIFSYVSAALKAIEFGIEKYPEKILSIKYEDLVTEPEQESKKIMSFCGLPWDESCLAFHEKQGVVSKTASHIQVRKAINKDALTAYQQYRTLFKEYMTRFSWLNE